MHFDPKNFFHMMMSWLLFFGLIFGAVWLALFAVDQGWNDALVVSGITLGSGGVIMLLSRVWAFNEDWNGWKSVFGTDLLHAIFSTMGPNSLISAALFGLMFKLSAMATVFFGFSFWPAGLPFLLQIALALVVAEFGYYWAHRTFHKSERLWPVHAVHHSSDKMYVLASARTHPLNTIVTFSLQVIPLIILGAPVPVILATSVFTTMLGMIQHSNLNLNLGPMNYVFCGPAVHHLHHSIHIDDSNHNFSSNVMIWDIVFGTFKLLDEKDRIRVVGLPGMEYGRNFLKHLISPFRYHDFEIDGLTEEDLP